MRNNRSKGGVFTWIIIAFIIIAGLYSWANFNTSETFTGEVTGKIVKRYKDDDKYLIFVALDDGTTRTVELTDDIITNRWTSSDDFGAIEEGNTYIFKTRGMRIPIVSEYPNIIEYDYVKGHFK